MPLKVILANKVIELRKRHKLSARELAEAVSVSPTTMVQIEKGRTATNLDILERIAKQLDVHPSVLLGGLDPGPLAQDTFELTVQFIMTCDEPSFKAIRAMIEARESAAVSRKKKS